ncbi:MAG: GDSL-type esterase/lipase family protein [Verrucomicrobiales bacterium]|jgi:lysophospholipase L1-like esterase|nr:GDSL-type esterase/lipase family protein [Verrucomicrobiales bacterium]
MQIINTRRLSSLIIAVIGFGAAARAADLVPVMPNHWVDDIHGGMVRDAQARADKIQIVFVGDSITARWTSRPGEQIWAAYYAPIGAINLGISSDRTEHVLWRLQHGALDPLHPRMVILLIGTNNLGNSEPEAVAYGVWAIVKYLREKLPAARVLVQGIFPREDQPALAPKILQTNALLAKLDDGQMVKYIDFGDRFLGPDGKLPPAIFTDKVHPNEPAGFAIWQANLQPIVEEWLTLAPVPGVPPPPAPGPVPADLAPATATARNDWLSRHQRLRATPPAYRERCRLLLLGDEDLVAFDRLPELFQQHFAPCGALNFAIVGNRPANIYWQVENGALDGLHPRLIVLQTQQALQEDQLTVSELVAYQRAIVNTIRAKAPDSKILLLAALPLGATPADPSRARVREYNELLAKLADGETIRYLDLGPAFLNPDGTAPAGSVPLLRAYNRQAYERWLELLAGASRQIIP